MNEPKEYKALDGRATVVFIGEPDKKRLTKAAEKILKYAVKKGLLS